jgi:hypothetical protein
MAMIRTIAGLVIFPGKLPEPLPSGAARIRDPRGLQEFNEPRPESAGQKSS